MRHSALQLHNCRIPDSSEKVSQPISLYTQICLWLTIIGIALRSYHYFLSRSLWVDEAMLALNIISRSFYDLSKPLEYNQIAPIGYLFIEKAVVTVFGRSEYALRALPFLSGLLSIWIFFLLARKILNQYAVVLAMALFVFSDTLIIHANEVKPYSTDVLMSVLLTWFFVLLIESHYARKNATILLIFGTIAIWLSFPSAFILAAIAFSWAWQSLRKNLRFCILPLISCSLIWVTSFGLQYLLIRHKITHGGMQEFWSGGFMPLIPTKLNDFRWYMDTFFEIFSDEPMRFFLPGLVGFSFLAGLASIYNRRSALLWLLLLPLLITLVISAFRLYPFHSRLILFLSPFLILIIAEGLEFVQVAVNIRSKFASNVLLVLVFIQPVTCQMHRVIYPFFGEEIKPVLEFVQNNIQPGDQLYIYYGAEPAFLYYQHRYLLDEYPVKIGNPGRNNLTKYKHDLLGLKGTGRIWFIFSHVPDWLNFDEERFFTFLLDNMGIRLAVYQSTAASGYLYKL